jgi:hypothetical protein
LASDGIDLTQVRAVTSGPAANIYIRLAGREPDGTVSQSEYLSLQQQVVHILKQFFDTNALYTLGAAKWPVFDKIYTRPADLGDPNSGRRTSAFIGFPRPTGRPSASARSDLARSLTPWGHTPLSWTLPGAAPICWRNKKVKETSTSSCKKDTNM